MTSKWKWRLCHPGPFEPLSWSSLTWASATSICNGCTSSSHCSYTSSEGGLLQFAHCSNRSCTGSCHLV
jgi:hypothetical protein